MLEQIQKSRAELSKLEQRFLERVAQTNRVKSLGVGGGGAAPPNPANDLLQHHKKQQEDLELSGNGNHHPSPLWLQPPMGYKQGGGAAMAAANLTVVLRQRVKPCWRDSILVANPVLLALAWGQAWVLA